jgi:hypothetical protein
MTDCDRFDSGTSSSFEPLDSVAVRDHNSNRCVESSVCDGIDQRLQIAAAS